MFETRKDNEDCIEYKYFIVNNNVLLSVISLLVGKCMYHRMFRSLENEPERNKRWRHQILGPEKRHKTYDKGTNIIKDEDVLTQIRR